MTTPQMIFDPFSEQYFENPFDIYRQMRDDAPLYYDSEQDFYALSRHEDVAAALKDHEAFSSSRGCDLAMVKGDEPPQKSIIFMDPPEHRHMRSLLNKAFTPRAVQAQRDTVVEQVEHYLGQIDSDEFDVVQDFSACSRSRRSPAWPASSRNTASRCGTGSTRAFRANPARSHTPRPG